MGNSRPIDKMHQKIKDFAPFFDDIIKVTQDTLLHMVTKTYKISGKSLFFPLTIFICMSAAIIAAGIFIYFAIKNDIEETWKGQLSGIVSVKSMQVESWKKERFSDIQSLVTNASFVHDVHTLLKSPADRTTEFRIKETFLEYCNSDYWGATLINLRYHSLVSHKISAAYVEKSMRDLLEQVKTEKRTILSDIHIHLGENKPHFDIAAPIFDASGVCAFVLLRVDPGMYFSPMITAWPIESKSAEILFAERQGDEVVYINPVRHRSNVDYPFHIRMSDTSILAVKGLSGFEGVTEGHDYRGVHVLGAIHRLSSTNWVMVAKVDHAEIYSAIYVRGIEISLVIILIISLGGWGMTMYLKNQRLIQAKELALFEQQKNDAQKQLLESEFKFSSLFNSMNEGVALHKLVYDDQGQAIDYLILDINPTYEKHTGIPASEAVGKLATEVYKVQSPPYFDVFSTVAATGVPKEFETYFPPLDRYFLISVSSPKAGTFATIFTDISDRKRSEIELEKREERLNALYSISKMDSADEAEVLRFALSAAINANESEYGFVALMDKKAIVPAQVYWEGLNDADEIIKTQFIEDYFKSDFLAQSLKTGKRNIDNLGVFIPVSKGFPVIKRTLQTTVKEKGHCALITVLFNKQNEYTLEDARNAELFFNEAWNLIQRANSSRKLEDSEHRFKMLAHAAFEGITILENGIIADVNEQMSLMTGYSRDGLINHRLIDFVAPHSRADLQSISQSDMIEPYEYDIVKKGGEVMPVEVRSRRYTSEGKSFIISTLRDMTKIKKDAEMLRESIRQFEQSNKELEQFAYVASHDLQEPLRMVSSFTQLLAKKYKGKLDADADEYIGYAVSGATRMQGLINDLLEYSRISRRGGIPQEISASMILGKAIINLKKKIDENRALITNDELPVISGDENQLIRLFQNLIDNGLKYRRESAPHVHVGVKQIEHGWCFSVRDNGIGIKDEYKERIFEIFERLHSSAEYPGTGIGLAICKKIVERHGGEIWVESNSSHGVTFYFTILRKES